MSNPANEPGGSVYDSQVPAQAPSDRLAFIKAVLAAGGWPDTASNEQFMLNWAQREHAVSDTKHASAAFNILNTGMPMPGATAFNSIVKDYPDFQTGVQATVKTIKQSLFKNVQAGLASGDANGWDAAGKFAQDLHAWSAGPKAPMTVGYTTVSNVNGGNGPLTGRGTSVTNTSGDTSGAQGTDLYGNIDGFLQSQAPALAAAFASDPEVANLLRQWGTPGGLSDQEFQNRLEQTTWWKTTPQSQRQLLVSQATDPATAQQNLTNQTSSVNTLAAKLGVGLTSAQAQQIALDSIKNQWSNDQIQQQVAQYAKYQGDITYKGEAAVDVNNLRGVYKAMALPVDNTTLNGMLQNVLGGKLTLQQVQDQVAQQAATFYAANPQLADFLKSGQGTAQQWAAPLISHVANIMGMDPNSIDLTNPQWSFLLKPQTNPQTGQSTGMAQTLDSVEQTVKTDPLYGYSKTANGITDYQNMIDKLQTAFTGGGV